MSGDHRLTRREALATGAAAGLAAALPRAADARSAFATDFAALGDGERWGPRWTTVGVANLRRAGGLGLLEAGSDVFPDDPRPVAFAVDRRLRDGEISAIVERPGAGPGVVLRRVAHRTYYAAVLDTGAGELALLRRTPDALDVLARVPARLGRGPLTLTLAASGARPTLLTALVADAAGGSAAATASDSEPALQRAGDPGVLATAETLLTRVEQRFAPFGNARLGLYGVQEGAALQPAVEGYFDLVRERSTVAFRSIAVRSPRRFGGTRPSVVAATTGPPLRGGARLAVAADVPARVAIELSKRPDFRGARVVAAGRTGAFAAAMVAARRLPPGSTVYWRARLRRRGLESVGPARSFRVPPRAGSGERVRLCVASCGSQFGPSFDHIAARRPDVLVWHGDLNYPDTHGPLAQTASGYAGIWRDFLSGPRLAPTLARAAFAPQRDDHDYGVQDANGADRPPPEWGLAPWDALMSDRVHYRFAAGLVEVWVLDQRRFKSAPGLPDTPDKTLLGERQRRWLLDTLAASPAPFKLVCSPCTLHHGDNARDGNWGSGFTAERDLILEHVATRVSGRTLFLTGDSHDTMVYDRDGVLELRACPVSIPDPRDHPGIGPGPPAEGYVSAGVVYADPRSHFAALDAYADGTTPVLDVALVREDGATPYARRLELPVPRRARR